MLDLPVQRFKGVETAAKDGNWATAKWMELLPAAGVQTMTDQEQYEAAKEEERAVKRQTLIAKVGASPGGGGSDAAASVAPVLAMK